MANTYCRLYIQVVFAVEKRRPLISSQRRVEIQKYITGIIKKRKQKLLAIYCMPDHAHILISLDPKIALSDLVRDIKTGSSKFINQKHWWSRKFYWQNGYGAFSYSHDHLPSIINYINRQEEHHNKKGFRNEYLALLNHYQINYDEKYVFDLK